MQKAGITTTDVLTYSGNQVCLKEGVLYKAVKTIEDGEYIDEIELVGIEKKDYDVCGRYGQVTKLAGDESIGDGAFWLTDAKKKVVKFDTDEETEYVVVREVVDKEGKSEIKVEPGSIKDLKAIEKTTTTRYTPKAVHVVKVINDETARLVYIFWTETEIGETKTITFNVDTAAHVSGITVNGAAVDGNKINAAKGQDAVITINPADGWKVSKVTVDGTELKANKDGSYTIPELTKNTKVQVETRKDESGVVTVEGEAGIAIVTVNGKRVTGTSEKIEGEVTIKVQQKAGADKIGSIVIDDVAV